jgi:hypothetical protein
MPVSPAVSEFEEADVDFEWSRLIDHYPDAFSHQGSIDLQDRLCLA